MQKRVDDMTVEELASALDEANNRLHFLGHKFNECDGTEYDEDMNNLKQKYGDEIFWEYANIGRIQKKLESLGV